MTKTYMQIIAAMVSSCQVPLADLQSGSVVATLIEANLANRANDSETAKRILAKYNSGYFTREDCMYATQFLMPLLKFGLLPQ